MPPGMTRVADIHAAAPRSSSAAVNKMKRGASMTKHAAAHAASVTAHAASEKAHHAAHAASDAAHEMAKRRSAVGDEEDFEHRRRALARSAVYSLTVQLNKPMNSLFRFSLTVLPMALYRFEVWFFTFLHCFLFGMKQMALAHDAKMIAAIEEGETPPETSWDLLAVLTLGAQEASATSHTFGRESTGAVLFRSLSLPLNAIGCLTWLMSLLLVFFNRECYTRFADYYRATTGMSGALQDLTQMSHVALFAHGQPQTPRTIAAPPRSLTCGGPRGRRVAGAVDEATARQQRWDVTRYLLTSAIVVYMRINDLAYAKPMGISESEWARLTLSEDMWLGLDALPKSKRRSSPAAKWASMSPPLLTDAEAAVIRRCPGKELQVLQGWAMRILGAAMADRQMTPQNFRALEEAVNRLRAEACSIVNGLVMPIPFAYYHALLLLMLLNYFLYSIIFVQFNSYLSPFVLFAVILLTTGIRELGAALANPFGAGALRRLSELCRPPRASRVALLNLATAERPCPAARRPCGPAERRLGLLVTADTADGLQRVDTDGADGGRDRDGAAVT